MALSAGNILEVRTTGSDTTCAGGFNPGNANMATDGAATVATGSSPVFTSASYNFVAGDVGAWLFIKSGTNWTPGWYQIASVASNAATLAAGIGSAVLYLGATNLNTAAGCSTTASPTGATWTVDYSQQNSAQIAYTDMVIGATTTQYTSVANVVGKNIVGNLIKVTSGTGFTVQTVEVVSTSTITATCDKSLGTTASTGGNGSLGGALASPGAAAPLVVTGNTVHLKGSTHTVTSASTNVSGGCVSVTVLCTWQGYGSIRGDGTRPTIIAGTISTFTLFANTGVGSILRDVIIDGAVKTSGRGVSGFSLHNVKAQNCTNTGIFGPNSVVTTNCEVTGCTTVAPALYSQGGLVVGCYVHDNTVTGVWATNSIDLISVNNTGGSSRGVDDGFTINAGSHINLTTYGNGSDGFRQQNNGTVSVLINLLCYGNGGYGINGNAQTVLVKNAALGGNTSGTTNGLTPANVIGTITLTSDPFTNKAAGDYSLNTTAGGGAACRAAGFPGVFPGGTTTGYADIGAVQHQDSGGGTVYTRQGVIQPGTYRMVG